MADSESPGFKLESFDHIGVVVKDLDATIKSWSSLLGIGPWTGVGKSDHVVKGASSTVGQVKVELLQPVEGGKPYPNLVGQQTVWADFLNTQGEGLHHICVRVADVDAAVAKLVAEGGEVIVSSPGGMAYVRIGGPGSIVLELVKTAQ